MSPRTPYLSSMHHKKRTSDQILTSLFMGLLIAALIAAVVAQLH
jgi:hypothetical protein